MAGMRQKLHINKKELPAKRCVSAVPERLLRQGLQHCFQASSILLQGPLESCGRGIITLAARGSYAVPVPVPKDDPSDEA